MSRHYLNQALRGRWMNIHAITSDTDVLLTCARAVQLPHRSMLRLVCNADADGIYLSNQLRYDAWHGV